MARRPRKKLEDFGEKMGGARKDYVTELRKTVTDLQFMADSTELSKLNLETMSSQMTKAELWPKPDYRKMVDQGMDISLVYAIKRIRDAVPAKPHLTDENAPDKIKLIRLYSDYLSYLDFMRTEAEQIKNNYDLQLFLDDHRTLYMDEAGPDKYRMRERYSTFFLKGKTANLDKILAQLDCQSEKYGLRINEKAHLGEDYLADTTPFQDEIAAKKFCYTLEMKAMADRQVFFISDLGDEYLCEMYWQGSGLMPHKFAITEKTVVEFAQKSGIDCVKPNTYVLYDAVRKEVLGINYKSCEEAVKDSVEFYKECNRRAREVRIKTQNKEIWEPKILDHPVRKGRDYRQSVKADESHFLNDLGMNAGEFGNGLPQQERQFHLNRCYDAFRDLAAILDIDPVSTGLGAELGLSFASRGVGGRGSAAAHYEPEYHAINLTRRAGPGCLAHEWAHAFDHYLGNDLGLFDINSKSSFATDNYKDPACPAGIRKCMEFIEESNYKKDSEIFDKDFYKNGTGYWSSNVELFARAFDCYIHDKLQESQLRNDYLTYNSESYVCFVNGPTGETANIVFGYPVGEERNYLNKCFDDIIKESKELGFLRENTRVNEKVKPIRTESFSGPYELSSEDYPDCSMVDMQPLFEIEEGK